MAYKDLAHLYRFLSPDFGEGNPANAEKLTQNPFYKEIARLVIDVKGKGTTWNEICTRIDEYSSGEIDPNDLAETKKNFKFLGFEPRAKIEKINDPSYFGSNVSGTSSVNPQLNKKNNMVVVAIRDPRVSISSAGCDTIGRFLNYTPSVIASQMIPFLDVEFRLAGDSLYTRVPGLMRFLLGVRHEDSLSRNDKTFFRGSKGLRSNLDGTPYDDKNNIDYMRTGMEMFLMPQSLSSMDTLGSGTEFSINNTRSAPAKPFLPLASIEGFDVTLKNAGAKNFQHKTANLKMKIHDKSRISEMAEFIRGGDGFRQVEIVTRYGWAVPNSSKETNEYFYFINKEMVNEDTWAIVNSQFSFDSTGQVNLGVQLVNAAARYLGRTNVIEVENKDLSNFNQVVAKINKYVDEIQAKNRFPATVTIATILKDASSKGFYSNKDSTKVENEITSYIKLLKDAEASGNPILQSPDIVEFEKALKELNKSTDKKTGKAGKSLYEKAQENAITAVKEKFKELKNKKTPDPWLPNEDKQKILKQFNPKLLTEIKKKQETGVASFAKVFLHFGQYIGADVNGEVQIIFYPINAGAGYAGSQGNEVESISLAEFPIDLQLLENVYLSRIKELNTTALSIEEFMKILIEENFSDVRSIAYGKSSFYTPYEVGKKEPAKIIKGSEDGMKNWERENVNFVLPQIGITVTTESPEGNPNYKIKKIHIFDKETKIYNDFSDLTIEQKKAELQNGVPLITIGTNGSLILNSSVASKTDGTQQAVYLAQAMKANPDRGTLNPNVNPVSDPANGLPLRTLPVQLTMTSLGCPIAQLYQKYFVDFFTGTSLDNLYMCTQIQHTLVPGKFTTSWTFMQDNSYSKFIKPKPPAVKEPPKPPPPAPPAGTATSGTPAPKKVASKANPKAKDPQGQTVTAAQAVPPPPAGSYVASNAPPYAPPVPDTGGVSVRNGVVNGVRYVDGQPVGSASNVR